MKKSSLLGIFLLGLLISFSGNVFGQQDFWTQSTNAANKNLGSVSNNSSESSATQGASAIVTKQPTTDNGTASSCSYNTCISQCAGLSSCTSKCSSCSDAPKNGASNGSNDPCLKAYDNTLNTLQSKETACKGGCSQITADAMVSKDVCLKQCTDDYNKKKQEAEDTQRLCATNKGTMGININSDCLKNGQCSFKIYDLLGMKQDIPEATRTSPTLFIQDILLSATFFIGTVLTLAFIFSGIKYIMAGANGKDPSDAKKGMVNSIIGLLLVIGSYSIIRLIQYIARGF